MQCNTIFQSHYQSLRILHEIFNFISKFIVCKTTRLTVTGFRTDVLGVAVSEIEATLIVRTGLEAGTENLALYSQTNITLQVRRKKNVICLYIDSFVLFDFNNKRPHGPHHSSEKPVQINKHICSKL